MTPTLSTTTNNGFRFPTSANNGTDFSTGIADLASDVDAKWLSGTLAARPAAATRNRIYYATDTGLFYLDTGSAWQTLINSSGVRRLLLSSTPTAISAGITSGDYLMISNGSIVSSGSPGTPATWSGTRPVTSP